MTEPVVFARLLWGFLILAAVVFPVLFIKTAPYGRHVGETRGPTLDATLGWMAMEAPSVLVFFLCFAVDGRPRGAAEVAFLLLWEAHYLHRAVVYPLRRRRRGGERRMALYVVAFGLTFTLVNAYLNGRWLFALAPAGAYGAGWLADPRFLAGAVLFVIGFAVNLWSDEILLRLRGGYQVPRGGLHRWVSCPNYLGEIVEWSGWAVMTWSLPGLAFAVWTAANLVPRARAHHQWYRRRFPGYPVERRALVPFLF